jgi:hypothetical protein
MGRPTDDRLTAESTPDASGRYPTDADCDDRLTDEMLDRLERYASTPDASGRYPTDADCDAYRVDMLHAARMVGQI